MIDRRSHACVIVPMVNIRYMRVGKAQPPVAMEVLVTPS